MNETSRLDAPAADASTQNMPANPQRQVVIVTGMSGAGKTVTLKALEDLGFEAVDNLPLSMLAALVRGDDRAPESQRSMAIGVDIRTRDFAADLVMAEIDRLVAESGREVKLLFIDCDDEVLRRRYTETRHRHPLAVDRPLIDGIQHERSLVAPLRERADAVIDTTRLPPGEMKSVLAEHLSQAPRKSLVVFVTSFSYRQGLPREADLVFDVRFLANPHYDPALRALTGLDAAVGKRIEQDRDFSPFMAGLWTLFTPLLPRYTAEGKSYLTIAIGCTGGKHRSVYIAERLAQWLQEMGQTVVLRHRDLDQGGNHQ